MNFFVNPPYFSTNVPRFLLGRHVVSFFRKLIEWSNAEYLHAINFYRERGNERAAKNIEKYFTPVTVLAKYPAFKSLCQNLLNDILWEKLSRHEQRIITNAYQKT